MATEAAPATGKKAIDPYVDPAGYLRSKGWELHDGNPLTPFSRWLDPTKPKKETSERVLVGTRQLPGKAKEDVYQLNVTPAAWPISRDEAVAEQMMRDEKAAKK